MNNRTLDRPFRPFILWDAVLWECEGVSLLNPEANLSFPKGFLFCFFRKGGGNLKEEIVGQKEVKNKEA